MNSIRLRTNYAVLIVALLDTLNFSILGCESHTTTTSTADASTAPAGGSGTPTNTNPDGSPFGNDGTNPKATPVLYSAVQVILNTSCVSCHGSSGGYSFSSYSGTLNAVRPGDPNDSILFNVVNGGLMPKGGAKLAQDEIQQISDWIKQGAKNN